MRWKKLNTIPVNKANKIIILIKIFDKKAFCKTGYNKTTITKVATKNIDALIIKLLSDCAINKRLYHLCLKFNKYKVLSCRYNFS